MSEANLPRAQTSAQTAAIGSVSLDDLIALNDEILALLRAGVPLERGLAATAGDLPGRFAQVTAALAQRMSQGESLTAAMATQPNVFPPVYRALVEAGLRCGRLAPVLEGLAGSVRKLRDVRQTVLAALVYPLGVVLLVCVLLVLFLTTLLPNLVEMYEGRPPAALAYLMALREHVGVWGVLVPLTVIAVFGLWWYRSSRVTVLTGSKRGLLPAMPGVRSLVSTVQAASLADVLALLLEHGVPLHEAVTLAADAVGDRDTRAAAQSLAQANLQGGVARPNASRWSGLTPFMQWLIASGQNERTLVPLVRHTGLVYRQRALRQADWLRVYLPALLTILIGGTATVAYVLTLFLPYVGLIKHLSLGL